MIPRRLSDPDSESYFADFTPSPSSPLSLFPSLTLPLILFEHPVLPPSSEVIPQKPAHFFRRAVAPQLFSSGSLVPFFLLSFLSSPLVCLIIITSRHQSTVSTSFLPYFSSSLRVLKGAFENKYPRAPLSAVLSEGERKKKKNPSITVSDPLLFGGNEGS